MKKIITAGCFLAVLLGVAILGFLGLLGYWFSGITQVRLPFISSQAALDGNPGKEPAVMQQPEPARALPKQPGPQSLGLALGQQAAEIQKKIRLGTEAYVRDVKNFNLEIEPFSLDRILQGKLDKLRIQANQGVLGDFRHDPLGLPFEKIDLTVYNLVLNPEKIKTGEIAGGQLRELDVNCLEIRDQAVNQVLAQSPGQERNLRVFFEQGLIKIRWLGKALAEADVSVQVAPDKSRPESDNVYFAVKKISISGMPVPNRVVNWLASKYNPLIHSRQLKFQLKLGSVRVQDGKMILGVNNTQKP